MHFRFIYIVCISVSLHTYMCTICMVCCLRMSEALVPWKWSFEWLWAIKEILGIEPGYSAQETNDLNHWDISPALSLLPFPIFSPNKTWLHNNYDFKTHPFFPRLHSFLSHSQNSKLGHVTVYLLEWQGKKSPWHSQVTLPIYCPR